VRVADSAGVEPVRRDIAVETDPLVNRGATSPRFSRRGCFLIVPGVGEFVQYLDMRRRATIRVDRM
jgi:hypothetical protein